MPVAIPLSLIALGIVWIGLARWLYARKNARVARAHAGWTSVEGEVVRAGVRQASREYEHGSHTEFLPDIGYRFTVEGKEYEGDCFDLARRHAFSKEEGARKLIGAYRAGARVPVRYDPANPSDNALTVTSPHHAGQWAITAVGLVFIGLGIFAWSL